MELHDRAEIRGARITRDGYLVADAYVAKADNIQEYRAAEIGAPDTFAADATVRLFRPASEVFAADSMASAAHRPVTLGHPPIMVDAKNWREFAKGDIGAEIARDGDLLRVSVKMMDADAIDAVQRDHREFSMGYGCTVDWTPGVHNGQAYDGVMRQIRHNHLAACPAARGGPELKIIDERPTGEKAVTLKTIMHDGLQIADVSASAEALINKLTGQVTDAVKAKDAAAADVVKLTAEAVAKDAKIVKLEADLAAAAITPAKLRDAGKAYAEVVAKAKALGHEVTDAMGIDDIKKTVVDKAMGAAAKDYSAEHIAIAFDAVTQGLNVEATDEIASVIDSGVRPVADAAAVRNLARNMQYN